MEWLELKFRRSEGAVEADQNKSRPPWERAAPAAQNTLTLGCLYPLGPLASLLLRRRSGATHVWAQLGLRAPRGQKSSSERGCHQLAPLALWSPQLDSPTPDVGADFLDLTAL